MGSGALAGPETAGAIDAKTSVATGRATKNVVPAPEWDCASMLPPALRMMLWLMARPRPVPCAFVVKKGTKRFFMIV